VVVSVSYIYKKVDGKPVRLKVGKYPDMSGKCEEKGAGPSRFYRPRRAPDVENGTEVGGNSLGDLFGHYIDEYAMHHCTTWKETKPVSIGILLIGLSALQKLSIIMTFSRR